MFRQFPQGVRGGRCVLRVYQSEFEEIVGRGAGYANQLRILLDGNEPESQDVALGIRTTIFREVVDQDAVLGTEFEGHRVCS